MYLYYTLIVFGLFLFVSNAAIIYPNYQNEQYRQEYALLKMIMPSIPRENDAIWQDKLLSIDGEWMIYARIFFLFDCLSMINEKRDFFDKLLIQIIIYELDWNRVIQNLVYLINNEDRYRDIPLLSNLSQLIRSVFDINYTNEKNKLVQFFQLLCSFLNQTLERNLSAEYYTPSLSSENEIDNMKFLINKTIQHINMNLLNNRF
jgi:hypothetical protein